MLLVVLVIYEYFYFRTTKNNIWMVLCRIYFCNLSIYKMCPSWQRWNTILPLPIPLSFSTHITLTSFFRIILFLVFILSFYTQAINFAIIRLINIQRLYLLIRLSVIGNNYNCNSREKVDPVSYFSSATWEELDLTCLTTFYIITFF